MSGSSLQGSVCYVLWTWIENDFDCVIIGYKKQMSLVASFVTVYKLCIFISALKYIEALVQTL